jgi:hypothetical protein
MEGRIRFKNIGVVPDEMPKYLSITRRMDGKWGNANQILEWERKGVRDFEFSAEVLENAVARVFKCQETIAGDALSTIINIICETPEEALTMLEDIALVNILVAKFRISDPIAPNILEFIMCYVFYYEDIFNSDIQISPDFVREIVQGLAITDPLNLSIMGPILECIPVIAPLSSSLFDSFGTFSTVLALIEHIHLKWQSNPMDHSCVLLCNAFYTLAELTPFHEIQESELSQICVFFSHFWAPIEMSRLNLAILSSLRQLVIQKGGNLSFRFNFSHQLCQTIRMTDKSALLLAMDTILHFFHWNPRYFGEIDLVQPLLTLLVCDGLRRALGWAAIAVLTEIAEFREFHALLLQHFGGFEVLVRIGSGEKFEIKQRIANFFSVFVQMCDCEVRRRVVSVEIVSFLCEFLDLSCEFVVRILGAMCEICEEKNEYSREVVEVIENSFGIEVQEGFVGSADLEIACHSRRLCSLLV